MERIAMGALRWKLSFARSAMVDCCDALRDIGGVLDGLATSGLCIIWDRVGCIRGMWVTVLALSTPIASTIPNCA